MPAFAAVDMMPDRDALDGVPVVIWGNTTEATGPITISFGDGTPDETPAFNVGSQSYIATTHVYAASATPYTASITVNGVTATAEISVFDATALTPTELEDLEINMAIQDGLRYQYFSVFSRESLHDAGWVNANWSNNGAFNAMVVLAFQNHGHNTTSGSIYSPVVQGGLNWVLDRLAVRALDPADPPGNPCVGPIANPCDGRSPTTAGSVGYSTSIVLLAMVGNGTPGAVHAGVGASTGETHAEIVQRLVNTVAWGQADPGTGGQGGWRYGLDDGQSDGSAIGWNVLGLLDAQAYGAVIPAHVATELEIEIASLTNVTGSMGYTVANSIANTAKTGVRLQSLSMVGVGLNDTTAITTVTPQASVDYINDGWNVPANTSCVWGADHPTSALPQDIVNGHNCIYSMFNVFKGLKLYGVVTLPDVPRADLDWHKFYQAHLQSIQTAPTTTTGGSFSALSAFGFGVPGETALGLLVLAETALILPDPTLFATIGLAPETATNPIGTNHTVTATARSAAGVGIPTVTIDFEVLTGPNAGLIGTGITDANGEVDFTYTDTGGPGTDTIQAFIGKGSGNQLDSNIVEKIWEDQQGLQCDIDADGDVDIDDVRAITAMRNTPVPPGNPAADIDGNGVIDVNDARQCVVQCTLPRCANP